WIWFSRRCAWSGRCGWIATRRRPGCATGSSRRWALNGCMIRRRDDDIHPEDAMTSFAGVLDRAARHHGGAEALEARLAATPWTARTPDELRAVPDDRFL